MKAAIWIVVVAAIAIVGLARQRRPGRRGGFYDRGPADGWGHHHRDGNTADSGDSGSDFGGDSGGDGGGD